MSTALSDNNKSFVSKAPSSIRTVWTIFAKELSSFFTTSVGYTVILGYVLTTSLFFLLILKILNEAGSIPPTQRPLSIFYKDYLILFIFMFFSSILSMRLFAQEKETGTIEMLLTVPVADWEVVLGKYFATVVFYTVCISPSLINSLVLFRPEIAHNLIRTIILPTLVFLPLIITAFLLVSSKHKWQILAAVLAGVFVFVVFLRWAHLDRITQRVAFIENDQIDFDNDSMSDVWEKQYDLDPTRADSREDPDGDGDMNFMEFVYGSDPTDPGSNLTSMIVEKVTPENILRKGDEDRDKDGIPDKYEKWLGLSAEDGSDARQDNDGDGDSNLLEWQYNTDLADPKKNLKKKFRGHLSLMNIIKKDFTDKDNDGMPDRWEESYGLDVSYDDSGEDGDKDGYSNREEYHYRTDPTSERSKPSLPESMAWFLHVASYILAAGLFLFVSYGYSAKQEDRIAYILKYGGIASIVLTAVIISVFLFLPSHMKTDDLYSKFLFWGFVPFFAAITFILSRLALLSRSKLNGAAVSIFLFLVLRLFWAFFIAEKAASQPDVGITLSGYAGGIILGGFFISIGIFFSSLFRNQINSAVVMFAFLVILFLTQFVPSVIPAAEPLKPMLEHYSFIRLLANFTDGNIHLGNLTFFVSAIIMFLFLTVSVLGMRKWK